MKERLTIHQNLQDINLLIQLRPEKLRDYRKMLESLEKQFKNMNDSSLVLPISETSEAILNTVQIKIVELILDELQQISSSQEPKAPPSLNFIQVIQNKMEKTPETKLIEKLKAVLERLTKGHNQENQGLVLDLIKNYRLLLEDKDKYSKADEAVKDIHSPDRVNDNGTHSSVTYAKDSNANGIYPPATYAKDFASQTNSQTQRKKAKNREIQEINKELSKEAIEELQQIAKSEIATFQKHGILEKTLKTLIDFSDEAIREFDKIKVSEETLVELHSAQLSLRARKELEKAEKTLLIRQENRALAMARLQSQGSIVSEEYTKLEAKNFNEKKPVSFQEEFRQSLMDEVSEETRQELQNTKLSQKTLGELKEAGISSQTLEGLQKEFQESGKLSQAVIEKFKTLGVSEKALEELQKPKLSKKTINEMQERKTIEELKEENIISEEKYLAQCNEYKRLSDLAKAKENSLEEQALADPFIKNQLEKMNQLIKEYTDKMHKDYPPYMSQEYGPLFQWFIRGDFVTLSSDFEKNINKAKFESLWEEYKSPDKVFPNGMIEKGKVTQKEIYSILIKKNLELTNAFIGANAELSQGIKNLDSRLQEIKDPKTNDLREKWTNIQKVYDSAVTAAKKTAEAFSEIAGFLKNNPPPQATMFAHIRPLFEEVAINKLVKWDFSISSKPSDAEYEKFKLIPDDVEISQLRAEYYSVATQIQGIVEDTNNNITTITNQDKELLEKVRLEKKIDIALEASMELNSLAQELKNIKEKLNQKIEKEKLHFAEKQFKAALIETNNIAEEFAPIAKCLQEKISPSNAGTNSQFFSEGREKIKANSNNHPKSNDADLENQLEPLNLISVDDELSKLLKDYDSETEKINTTKNTAIEKIKNIPMVADQAAVFQQAAKINTEAAEELKLIGKKLKETGEKINQKIQKEKLKIAESKYHAALRDAKIADQFASKAASLKENPTYPKKFPDMILNSISKVGETIKPLIGPNSPVPQHEIPHGEQSQFELRLINVDKEVYSHLEKYDSQIKEIKNIMKNREEEISRLPKEANEKLLEKINLTAAEQLKKVEGELTETVETLNEEVEKALQKRMDLILKERAEIENKRAKLDELLTTIKKTQAYNGLSVTEKDNFKDNFHELTEKEIIEKAKSYKKRIKEERDRIIKHVTTINNEKKDKFKSKIQDLKNAQNELASAKNPNNKESLEASNLEDWDQKLAALDNERLDNPELGAELALLLENIEKQIDKAKEDKKKVMERARDLYTQKVNEILNEADMLAQRYCQLPDTKQLLETFKGSLEEKLKSYQYLEIDNIKFIDNCIDVLLKNFNTKNYKIISKEAFDKFAPQLPVVLATKLPVIIEIIDFLNFCIDKLAGFLESLVGPIRKPYQSRFFASNAEIDIAFAAQTAYTRLNDFKQTVPEIVSRSEEIDYHQSK